MLLIVLAAGCGAPAERPAKKGDDSPAGIPSGTAEIRAGSATRYSEGETRQPLWTVKWSTAEIEYNSRGEVGGAMQEVSGTIFDAGRAASRFSAREAVAEFGSRSLAIEGGVELEVDEGRARIRCDSVLWDPSQKRIEARGTVVMEAEGMTFGPFETLYASPDLREISTPALFRKQP